MKKVEIEIALLTPMFSSSADTGEAEFRLTELKSLLRTTFRELYIFKDLKDMKTQEKMLFGSMEEKSPIAFRLKKKIECDQNKKKFLLPHKNQGKQPCLQQGDKIELYIFENTSSDAFCAHLAFYVHLLIQASIIGGLGKRSRKGFGSFKVTNIKFIQEELNEQSENIVGINSKFNELLKCDPIKFLKEENVGNSFSYKERIIDENYSIKFTSLETAFDFPYAKKITVLEIKDNNIDNILKSLSQLTHDRLNNIESKEIEPFMSKTIMNNIHLSILGNFNGDKSIDRYASPICTSIYELNCVMYLIIKELNYNYILSEFKNHKNDNKADIEQYINKYIYEISIIAGGGKE